MDYERGKNNVEWGVTIAGKTSLSPCLRTDDPSDSGGSLSIKHWWIWKVFSVLGQAYVGMSRVRTKELFLSLRGCPTDLSVLSSSAKEFL